MEELRRPIIKIQEQLGVSYQRVLVPVGTHSPTALSDGAGALYPVQTVPALAFDRTEADSVSLVVADLAPGRELELSPCDTAKAPAGAISVEAQDNYLVITNADLAVKVPADAQVEQPFPGPLVAMRAADGKWFGTSLLSDAPVRGAVFTDIESIGPCCVQWRTTYRWGCDAGVTFRVRWAAGSDTLLVDEEVFEDSDAAVEWYPFGDRPAKAYVWGGGEGSCPMRPLEYRPLPGSVRGTGRRKLGSVSHIGYWNQWNWSWVGFSAGDDRFVGLFPACGGSWRRRGHMKLDIYEDDGRGDYVRFPLKRGRRFYGMVISNRTDSGMEATEGKCLLNRRKTQLSDLALPKVLGWELNPPLEPREPHLVRKADLDTFRDRIASDTDLVAALDGFLSDRDETSAGWLAVSLWKNDPELMKRAIDGIVAELEGRVLGQIAQGGYERLIIFDGRLGKRLAYDVDVLWALGLLGEADYRRIRKVLLALAYMFADPDYCVYSDFWPHIEPEEGVVEALKDEMGDAPVPPNFADEFFTTTGVMAELFERHPLRDEWRRFAIEHNQLFLDTFYAADGTYRESINYQTHEFNERLCLFYPLWFKGVHDFFADERVKGTFRFSAEVMMPKLSDGVPSVEDAARQRWGSLFGRPDPPRAMLPANGNSGGNGFEQEIRGELTLGAWVYRESDPVLAGQLMHAWREAGKPIPMGTHPVLTVVTLDATIESVPVPMTSCHRLGLGVVSKARKPDGAPVWCLFRAGTATHHMDFDQGNLHLAAWDSVLLGEHGYHTFDNEGGHPGAAATWLHSTVVYSDDREMSCGYTGLERAPSPALVHLSDEFDWCVHRIVNTNYRRLETMRYTDQLPARRTQHVRHYLFVKPDYFLVWDVFEEAHQASTFWLHPRLPMTEVGPGAWRAGEPGKPHLLVRFIQPEKPEVVENRRFGPLWNFAVRNETGRPYLVLLVPARRPVEIDATWDAPSRVVRVAGTGLADTIHLPEPGCMELPRLVRG